MTMITPSYLGETIEYSSLHACRSTLEDPTRDRTSLKSCITGSNMPTSLTASPGVGAFSSINCEVPRDNACLSPTYHETALIFEDDRHHLERRLNPSQPPAVPS